MNRTKMNAVFRVEIHVIFTTHLAIHAVIRMEIIQPHRQLTVVCIPHREVIKTQTKVTIQATNQEGMIPLKIIMALTAIPPMLTKAPPRVGTHHNEVLMTNHKDIGAVDKDGDPHQGPEIMTRYNLMFPNQ
jgi:hypothetical protein